jgi:hypothetical protein
VAEQMSLQRIATAVAAVAAAVVVLSTALWLGRPLLVRLGVLAPAVAYAVGDRFDGPATVYARHDRTLVIVATSACGACQAAKPALSTLAEEARRRGAGVVLVAPAGPGERAFARDVGLADSLVELDVRRLRVTRVPALMLVDRLGTVLLAREGIDVEAVRLVRQHLDRTRPHD